MTQSVWVIRDRESGHYWNGFGFTTHLGLAKLFPEPPGEQFIRWLPFACDVLELRLIERDSDAA